MSAYLLFLALSAGVGFAVLWAAAKRAALPSRFVWDTWFASAALAWFGARVASGWLQAVAPDATTDLLGQGISSGGIASIGAIAVFLVAITGMAHLDRRVAHRPAEARDCFLPSLAAAEAVARLGCFSAGCCHGTPAYSLPWAVTFPETSACSFAHIPVHPTQLYQSLGCLGLAVLLYGVTGTGHPDRRRVSGLTLYLVGYGSLRFVVESFRGDLSPSLGGTPVNSCLSLGLVGLGILHAFRHGILPAPGTPASRPTVRRGAT
ncbi:MAG: prolipoprotein diacylglyceryl transferase [Verrucomicrobiales bacterium]|nr:prolipoprotein diacylglyceryl transferase [Verrucomicrobiales bacterium]